MSRKQKLEMLRKKSERGLHVAGSEQNCTNASTPRHEHVLGCGGTAPLILNVGNRWR
jgi:hypothetical protein